MRSGVGIWTGRNQGPGKKELAGTFVPNNWHLDVSESSASLLYQYFNLFS
jgi:hypothetical protein